MRRPRLLLVKTGTAPPAWRELHGDFERWFAEALGDADRLSVASVFDSGALPPLRAFDGVVVMGSPLSVTSVAPWMEQAGSRLREHAEAGGALLAVCFGHQLLAHAFGAPVVPGPKGPELGTVRVQITAAGRRDPLFAGLGPVLEVQAMHGDAVSEVPVGATLLASNEACATQAFALGHRARSVQFHPEATAAIVRTVARRDPAPEERGGVAAGERAYDAPDGRRILRNFEEHFAGG